MNQRCPVVRYILCLIIGIGTFLRFYAIDRQSLWLDEAFSGVNAQSGIREVVKADVVHPPLHLLLLHFWLKLKKDDLMLRLPSAIFGSLSLPLIYYLSKTLFGTGVGLIATLLLSVSGFHIYYSQEGRMYGMLMTLCLASSACLVKAVTSEAQRSSMLWWAAYALLITLSSYTHFMAFPFLAANLIWLVSASRSKELPNLTLRKAAPFYALIALLILPSLMQALLQGSAHSWAKQGFNAGKGLACALTLLLDFNANYTLGLSGNRQALSVPIAVLLFVQLPLSLYLLSLGTKACRDKQGMGFLLLHAFVPAAAYVFIGTFTFWGRTKYSIMAMPFYLMLVSVGLCACFAYEGARWRLRIPHFRLQICDSTLRNLRPAGPEAQPTRRSAALVVVACYFLVLTFTLSAVSLRNYFSITSFQRPDWKRALPYLEKHHREGDIVLVQPSHQLLIQWYLGSNIPVLDRVYDDNLLAHYERAWLLLCPWEPGAEVLEKRLRSLESQSYILESKEWPNIRLWLFGLTPKHSNAL